MDQHDPGWGQAWRGVFDVFLPRVAVARQGDRANQGQADSLTVLRRVFVMFATMNIGVAVVVVVLAVTVRVGAGVPAVAGVAGVVGFGLLSLLGTHRLVMGKPLDCSSDAVLATSYRVRFFLGMGTTNSIALVGFVGYILSGSPVAYVVGLAIGVTGLFLLAPTASNLARQQADLVAEGCPRSLVQALSTIHSFGP